MKLVILTQYYPPETGAPQNRLSDLAKRFVKWGHEVEVLTALPNYPENTVFEKYQNRKNTSEMLDGVRVSRVGIYVPEQKTFIKRIFHYLSFAWNARFCGPKLISGADIVFMESPPLFIAWAGVFLSKKWRAKLATNISDLWPQSAIEMGMLTFGPAIVLAEKLESWMYENSSLITGQTEGIVKNISNKFPDKKVRLFPNGVDTLFYRDLPDRNQSRARFGWSSGLFVIGYAGILGHAQKLGQILDAALLLKDLPQVHFALFGDGPCKESLLARIHKEHIQNVKVYPKVNSGEISTIYAGMDCGCVPLGKEKVFKGARPSKMFEMMAAGLPILLCAEGESAEILKASREGPAGSAVGPEMPELFAQQVRDFFLKRMEIREMGDRGRRYVFEYFDREKIAKNLEKEFLAVLINKGSQ